MNGSITTPSSYPTFSWWKYKSDGPTGLISRTNTSSNFISHISSKPRGSSTLQIVSTSIENSRANLDYTSRFNLGSFLCVERGGYDWKLVQVKMFFRLIPPQVLWLWIFSLSSFDTTALRGAVPSCSCIFWMPPSYSYSPFTSTSTSLAFLSFAFPTAYLPVQTSANILLAWLNGLAGFIDKRHGKTQYYQWMEF